MDALKFFDIFYDWVEPMGIAEEGAYSERTAKKLLAFSPNILGELKKGPHIVYRALAISKNSLKKLLEGQSLKLKMRSLSSWAQTLDAAKLFGDEALWGNDVVIIIKQKISSDAIILNCVLAGKFIKDSPEIARVHPETLLRNLEYQIHFRDEQEVILNNKIINLTGIEPSNVVLYRKQQGSTAGPWKKFERL